MCGVATKGRILVCARRPRNKAPVRTSFIRLFPIGVVVHLRDDQPRPVDLALENPKGVVVPHLDLSTTHELLALDLQVRRHEHDLGGEHPQGRLGRRLQRPRIEVVSENRPRRYATISSPPFLTVPNAFTQSASGV